MVLDMTEYIYIYIYLYVYIYTYKLYTYMYNHYVYYESHSIARKQDAAAYKSTIMYTCMQNTTTLCYVFKHK